MGALILLLGYGPLLFKFFRMLWAKPHYQFFPTALIGAAFLAWARFQKQPSSRPGRGSFWLSALLLTPALLLLGGAAVVDSPWLCWISFLFLLAGLTWWLGGPSALRSMTPTLVVLLSILPPPLNWDVSVALWLGKVAMTWSSRILDLIEVPHVLSGNVIEVADRGLLVEEACSGINSLVSTTSICLLFALWKERRLWHLLLLVVVNVMFVMVGNTARVTAGILVYHNYKVDYLLVGTTHSILSVCFMAVYVGLMFSADQVITFFVEGTSHKRRRTSTESAIPRPVSMAPNSPIPPPTPQPRLADPAGAGPKAGGWSLLVSEALSSKLRIVLVAVAALVAVSGVVFLAKNQFRRRISVGETIPDARLSRSARFAPPERIGPWQRVNEVPQIQQIETMGVYSEKWHYRNGSLFASLALDYPFQGYHDVRVCYQYSGWNILRTLVHRQLDTVERVPYTEVELEKELVKKAYLLFSTVDENGNWWEGSFQNSRPGGRFAGVARAPTTYRVQVLAVYYAAMSDPDKENVRTLFTEARASLADQLLKQIQK